jgi:hypothetical protein
VGSAKDLVGAVDSLQHFEQRARLLGVESIRQAALDMGILKQAEGNAEESIRTLLQLAGVKTVTIIPAGVS